MEICSPLDQHIAASIVQLVAVIPGVLWLLFVYRGAEKSRPVFYLAIGWVLQGALYANHAIFCGAYSVAEVPASDLARSTLTVVDSSLSLFSSALLLMCCYLLRDLRLGVFNEVGDENPTMSKGFVFKVVVGLTVGLSAYIATVNHLINNQFLKYLYMGIDVLAATCAGILLGIELYRSAYIKSEGNSPLFGKVGFARARLFCLITFIIWGLAQLGHPASELGWRGFEYPTGVFYNLLAVLKVLCAAGAGVVAMHMLPEKEQYRHASSRKPGEEVTVG